MEIKKPEFWMILINLTLILAMSNASMAATVFSDDMEGGLNGWNSTGFWHQATNPENTCIISDINPRLVSLPDDGCLPTAYSSSTVWWYGESSTGTFISADYVNYTQTSKNGGHSTAANSGDLISPTIDLTGASTATLAFMSWYEIEGVDVDRYDLMSVYISTDGGSSYTLMGKINPINDVNGESFRPYSSGGLGQVGIWVTQQFDLSQYTGYQVKLKFEFRTVDALYNGFRGWLIDDVSVTTDGASLPTITSVTPSSGVTGTIISIAGTNFLNGANVSIGGYQSDTVSVVSSTLIHAIVPSSLSSGTYDVTVTNPTGQSVTLTDGFTVTSTQPPSITSISPDSGFNTEETSVTISGSNFQSGATAEIASTPLTGVTVVSTSTITATVPTGLPGGYQNVKVTNPDSQYDILVGGFYVNSSIIATDFDDLDDSYVNSASPGSNYGSLTYMYAGTESWGSSTKTVYVKFDISSIPSGAVISSAKAYLKVGGAGYCGNAETISAYYVMDDSWDESTITHNNQPCGANFDNAVNCNLNAEDSLSVTGSTYGWTVTNMVSSEVSGGNDILSIALKGEGPGQCDKPFYSKEYSTSSYRPYLEVVYTTTTSTTTSTTSTSSTTSTTVPHYVGTIFVSSTQYSGNIGGLSGADDYCQARANAAGLAGTWKALLSTSSTDTKDRIPDTTYKRMDGAVIATSKSDLFDGTVTNEINITELYTGVYADTVWTGSYTSGVNSGHNCNSWTTSSSSYTGTMGHTHTTHSWIAYLHSALCGNTARLYCVMTEGETTTTTTTTTTSSTSTTSTTLSSDQVYVDPYTQTVNVGDTVTVTIEVNDVTDLYSFQFDAGFDPSVLEAVSIVEGDFLSSGGGITLGFPGTINNTAGTIAGFAYTLTGGASGVSGSGTLATLTFTALVEGTSDVSLSNVMLSDSTTTEIPSTSSDGSVTVEISTPGDVNGDGNVNVFDLALMGQAWGSSSGDSNYNAGADLNGDGVVNVFDLAILGQNWGT